MILSNCFATAAYLWFIEELLIFANSWFRSFSSQNSNSARRVNFTGSSLLVQRSFLPMLHGATDIAFSPQVTYLSVLKIIQGATTFCGLSFIADHSL